MGAHDAARDGVRDAERDDVRDDEQTWNEMAHGAGPDHSAATLTRVTPAESTPIEPTPADRIQVEPTPADSAQVAPTPADSAQVEPEQIMAAVRGLGDDDLRGLAELVRDVQIERAIAGGDHDAIIDAGFAAGFGRDGLGVLPWVEGDVIVCPGGLVASSRSSHRCRFVSVDDVWVWDSGLLLREDKRATPGATDGFRAIALIPRVDGTALDVVSGRARSGRHAVHHVVSYEVRRGALVEVSQRSVAPTGMH